MCGHSVSSLGEAQEQMSLLPQNQDNSAFPEKWFILALTGAGSGVPSHIASWGAYSHRGVPL